MKEASILEIERKFLVKDCPRLDNYPLKKITQAYISTDPVIRIREMANQYFLTVKSQGHMVREEFDMAITKEQYDCLYAKIENYPIEKIRYFIPIQDNLTAELDIYAGHLDGLMTVEVEFTSMLAADHFTPPCWFGKDITLDNRYKNNNLSIYGIPKQD